jgi:hypothetical protein
MLRISWLAAQLAASQEGLSSKQIQYIGFEQMLHTHLSYTIGQSVTDVLSGLSLTPPHKTKRKERRKTCPNFVAVECAIWMKLRIITGWYDIKQKYRSVLSYNPVVLKTECQSCVMLAIFMSDSETLNFTKHRTSRTNQDIWTKLELYRIHKKPSDDI